MNKNDEQMYDIITLLFYVFWSSLEPTVSPRRINATALTAFEIQVSWDPIQHLNINGVLRGYEVSTDPFF